MNLHVHYDRRVLDEPFAAAVGTPVQWLFDRTGSSGVCRGQLVAVSLSAADGDLGEPVATLRERYLPALARLLPAAAARRCSTSPSPASRAPPSAPRPGAAACGRHAHGAPGLYLAGAWTDTGWPATMERRGSQRARGGARGPRRLPGRSARHGAARERSAA